MTALHSQPYKDLIERVIRRRLELGWSQEELARRLPRYAKPPDPNQASEEPGPDGGGQLQSFVSKFEQRQRRLDVIEFQHLCHVLGLRLCELLPEHDWNGEAPPALVPLAREPLIEERALTPRRARGGRSALEAPPAERGLPAAVEWRPGPPLGGAERSVEAPGHEQPLAADSPPVAASRPRPDARPAAGRRRGSAER